MEARQVLAVQFDMTACVSCKVAQPIAADTAVCSCLLQGILHFHAQDT